VIALETYASADARRKGTAAQDKGNRTGVEVEAGGKHDAPVLVPAETDANANAAHLPNQLAKVTIAFKEALEILSLLFLGESDTYICTCTIQSIDATLTHKITKGRQTKAKLLTKLSLYADCVAQTPEP